MMHFQQHDRSTVFHLPPRANIGVPERVVIETEPTRTCRVVFHLFDLKPLCLARIDPFKGLSDARFRNIAGHRDHQGTQFIDCERCDPRGCDVLIRSPETGERHAVDAALYRQPSA